MWVFLGDGLVDGVFEFWKQSVLGGVLGEASVGWGLEVLGEIWKNVLDVLKGGKHDANGFERRGKSCV